MFEIRVRDRANHVETDIALELPHGGFDRIEDARPVPIEVYASKSRSRSRKNCFARYRRDSTDLTEHFMIAAS